MATRKHLFYGATMMLSAYLPTRLLLLRVMALILSIATFQCTAALAEPSLVSTPEVAALRPERGDRVIVTLRDANSGRAHLHADAPPGILVTIKPITVGGRPARAWLVSLSASSTFDADGTIMLTARAGRRLTTGVVPVKLIPAPTAASQLQAEVSFEGETLLDGLTRPLILRISNLSDAATRVEVLPRLPIFLSAEDGAWKKPHKLPARTTTLISIPIKTAGTAEHPLLSGKHEVAVVVNATRGNSASWSGQVAAVTTLSVGIPGMSEVQGLLQVPSFLLFPGFLLITAFMLMVSIGKARCASDGGIKDHLSVPWSSGLWLIAITFSMLLVPLYPYVSRLLGTGPRNILYGFDLGDVIRVWFVSIMLGSLAGLAVLTWREWAARQTKARTFSEQMTPVELLRRLGRLGQSTNLPCITLQEQGDPRIHDLGQRPSDGRAWATSSIACIILDASKPGFDQRRIGEAIRNAKPALIAERLEEAERTGAIAIKWQQTGVLTGVGTVDASMFSALEPKEPIVTLTRGGRVQ